MRAPVLSQWRGQLPALAIAVLVQLAAIWAFLHALVLPKPPSAAHANRTEIVFVPTALAPAPVSRKRTKSASGEAAAPVYVNPGLFNTDKLAPPNIEALATALSACDPGKYDMAADEVKALCDRIGALVRYDPGHFGVKQDVADPAYWRREMIRRDAPFLMLCMKPTPPANKSMIIAVDLATLSCIYNLMMHPYDPEKRARYNE